MIHTILIAALGLLAACNRPADAPTATPEQSTPRATVVAEATSAPQADRRTGQTTNHVPAAGTPTPDELVDFAELFYGVPYQYGSSDPAVGFDCSGYINYVFNHFNISVPRSSVDFTHVGTPVEVTEAQPGDLVLFTGTNPGDRTVGHIGIVVKNDPEGLEFIHSSSGKQHAVTVSPLEGYYENRFVKVIRLI
jgi:cell wall-associated NlpC family hydrolase